MQPLVPLKQIHIRTEGNLVLQITQVRSKVELAGRGGGGEGYSMFIIDDENNHTYPTY